MTTRTVAVRLQALNDQFDRAYKASGRNARELQQEIARGAKSNKADFDKVGRGAVGMGVALLGGFTLAAAANMKFEKSLSGVKAVSNATAGEMDKLRTAALKAGADTVFSASQAADAEAELAKAGVSVSDVLGGALSGSLSLAAAGQLDLADAATISAQAMNIFKLKGSDVTHIADVLASGANKSAADVKQLGDALRQGGLSAAQAGIGLEETVGVLAAFHDNALVGSDAGTSFKTMIAALIPVSDRAKTAMEQINLQAYDAQGNFVGLEAVAGQLKAGLGPLSEEERNNALQTIFGNDAKRAAAVLYEQGAEGVRDYTKAMNDNGAAARMAATQMDNLAGDIEQLKGSIETALIQSGSQANGVLRGMAQAATGVVNSYGRMNPAVQGGATVFAGIAGAAALAGGAFLIAAPRIVETKKALGTLNSTMPRTSRLMTGLAGAGAKAGVALTALVAIDAAFNGADSGFSRWMEELEARSGAGSQAAIAALTDEMERLRDVSNSGANTDFGFTNIHWTDWSGGAAAAGDKADALQERIAELKHQMTLAGIEAKGTTGATGALGGEMSALGEVVDGVRQELESYSDQLDRLNGLNISAAQSAIDLRKSKVDLNKATKHGGKVTDDETSALLDFAAQANDTANAIYNQTNSVEDSNASLRTSRKAFINAAVAAGHTRAQAKKLADQFFNMPKAVATEVTAPGLASVSAQVRALNAMLAGLRRGAHVSITSSGVTHGTGIWAGSVPGSASGGWVGGNGGPRADDQLRALSTGEFVVNAADASANRALLEAINHGGRMSGMADGGWVAPAKGAAPAQSSGGGGIPIRDLIHALEGVEVVLNGQKLGALQAREADIHRRS